jgi:hypothetical protein
MHQSMRALRARLANRYALRQRFMHGVMRFRFLIMFLLCGCSSVQAPDTPEQRALNSCFFSNEQMGWSSLEAPPDNAAELKALALSKWPRTGALDERYQQFWFNHADGRLLACSLFPVGNLPAVCGATKYEFTRTSSGWSMKDGDLIMCHERVR